MWRLVGKWRHVEVTRHPSSAARWSQCHSRLSSSGACVGQLLFPFPNPCYCLAWKIQSQDRARYIGYQSDFSITVWYNNMCKCTSVTTVLTVRNRNHRTIVNIMDIYFLINVGRQDGAYINALNRFRLRRFWTEGLSGWLDLCKISIWRLFTSPCQQLLDWTIHVKGWPSF